MKLKILIFAVLLVPALGWGQVTDADRQFVQTVKTLDRLVQQNNEHEKNIIDLVAVVDALHKRLEALERRQR